MVAAPLSFFCRSLVWTIHHHPDPQTTLALDKRAETVAFVSLNQIKLFRSTYKVTSYADFAPYVQLFKKFGTYLVNFTGDLNSPDIMKHFKVADITWLFWIELI